MLCLKKNKVILYADIIYSSFFLLSRKEEIIKRDKRDQYGRFLLKYSFLKNNDLIYRPIVDEYSKYLTYLVYKFIGKEKLFRPNFSKIWLTHDVDSPFYFSSFFNFGIYLAKNIVKFILPNYQSNFRALKSILGIEKDEYYTFPYIIDCDSKFIGKLSELDVEVIYFLITAKASVRNGYCDIRSKKFTQLLALLKSSKASFGIHLSHDSGINPQNITKELYRYPFDKKNKLYSRHHYLRWREPEQFLEMEKNGITDDFTLSFADSIGFRVGTSRSYCFIDPLTGNLSNLKIHPLEIMECSLGNPNYMGLDYKNALDKSITVINNVFKYNGELNILFHNSSFSDKFFNYKKLYTDLFNYISNLYLEKI